MLYIVFNVMGVFEGLSSVWEDRTTCHCADQLVRCFSTEMLQVFAEQMHS